MQKCMFLFAFIVLACNNEKAKPAESAETATKPAVALPYLASYSSSFEMGDPAYVATILKGEWKAWEENKMDSMKSWMADTVLTIFSDNTVIRGSNSVVNSLKKYRALFSNVTATINAAIPVYSTDKKENWALIWATEIDTRLNGSKDTTAWMESWRFNKDGKADLLLQFDRAKRKQ